MIDYPISPIYAERLTTYLEAVSGGDKASAFLYAVPHGQHPGKGSALFHVYRLPVYPEQGRDEILYAVRGKGVDRETFVGLLSKMSYRTGHARVLEGPPPDPGVPTEYNYPGAKRDEIRIGLALWIAGGLLALLAYLLRNGFPT